MKEYRATIKYRNNKNMILIIAADSIKEAYIQAQLEVQRLYTMTGKQYIIRSLKEKK
jgi:hypothetical protein